MPTVTVPQVNPNDEVTANSVNQGPNALATVVNGQLDDANINTISGSKISAGTLPASSFDVNSNPETREYETVGDIVASGLIWSQTTGLTGTMTAGVAYVNGKRISVPAVTSYVFTGSRDTYVYVDSNGVIQYNPVTNGASQPVTPAGYQIIARIITSASAITSISDLRVISASTPWRTWTPVFSNFTLGNANISYAKFTQIGKTVHFRIKVILGTTSAVTGAISFSPPVQTASYDSVDTAIHGEVIMIDSGVNFFKGQLRWGNPNYFTVNALSASGTYVTDTPTSASVPFTWGAVDVFSIAGTYEAAA